MWRSEGDEVRIRCVAPGVPRGVVGLTGEIISLVGRLRGKRSNAMWYRVHIGTQVLLVPHWATETVEKDTRS